MASPLPGHPPAVTAPSPHRKGISGLATGVAILVLCASLAVCALPVLGLFAWMSYRPDIDKPKAAAGQYLQRIEAGDDAGAYQLLCAQTRREKTLVAFSALVAAGPRPVDHTVIHAVFLDEPGYTAGVDVRLTDRTGATRQISLVMTTEKEAPWLVCGERLI